jgi:hypothetical protein
VAGRGSGYKYKKKEKTMISDEIFEARNSIKDYLANDVTNGELNQQDKALLEALQAHMYTVQSHFEAVPDSQKIMTVKDFETESSAIMVFRKYLD